MKRIASPATYRQFWPPKLSKGMAMLEEQVVTIVSAYVGHNTVAADQVPQVIATIHAARSVLGKAQPEPMAMRPEPAVTIRRSVRPDSIICLECGYAGKM